MSDSDSGADPSSPSSSSSLEAWRERLDLLVTSPAQPGRWYVAAVALVVLVIGGVVVFRKDPPPPELSLPMAASAGEPSTTSTTSTVPAEIVVHAAGSVNQPGIYYLPSNARVADLIERAGGPAKGAEIDAINLASPLVDGQRVYIPRKDEIPAGAMATGIGSSDVASERGEVGKMIDLNTATADQLEALPGVGPATAKSILEARKQKGRFNSVDELLDIRGIGEAKMAEIRPLVRV